MRADLNNIRHLYANNLLQDIDIQFADLLSTLAGKTASQELALAAVLVSNTTSSEKHICLDLRSAADRPLAALFAEIPDKALGQLTRTRTPALDIWTAALKASPVVGPPGAYRPLVLDGENRLYLYRYWAYEHSLAGILLDRADADRPPVDAALLAAGLKRYFPESGQTPDWQRVAAYTAVTGRLAIISGGPGTGKTHTVTNILALLLEQEESLRIAVCAPTGKAAARVQESIKKSKQGLPCPPQLLTRIPETATTIHRLLGVKQDSNQFYHDHRNRLPVDVLIVDEASMVSLALMTKLLQATPEPCRVILLGDRNQLASVEAGAVLGDICAAADTGNFSKTFCERYAAMGADGIRPECSARNAALSDCAVELFYSYRFDASSTIGTVSQAVNAGESDAAMESMAQDATGAITRRRLPAPGDLVARLNALFDSGYAGLFSAPGVAEAYAALENFRILCSHRRGPYGIDGINRRMEAILHARGLVDPAQPDYRGRPIMINRNDYNLQLYNGDIGIVWPDAEGTARVWFPDRAGGFRALSPARLPAHETVYAMTIHKSQGSEFDRVVVILPDVASPVFTRELIYTGITRARRQVTVGANDDTFAAAVRARVARRSGLRDNLQGRQ